MKKMISLVLSGMMMLSMVITTGCSKKSDLDKAYEYVTDKYNINNAIIEKIDETNFITVIIFTDKTKKDDEMIEDAEFKQEQIQTDVLRQGYDVAVTVSYVNENLENRYVYVAMADVTFYEK